MLSLRWGTGTLSKGRPVEEGAGPFAAACAFGAALSFFAAARVVAGEIAGVPASTVMWLWAGLPWFVPVAALAAWMGGHGAVWFARRGWNPAFRGLEGLGVAAVTALLVELAGGYRFPRDAPWWAAIAASIPALEAAAAWLAANWLTQAMRPVALEGRTDDPKAWAEVYRSLRDRLLALALAVAGSWAAASLGVAGNPGAGGPFAVAGGVLFVACGAALVARVHQKLIELELESEGAKVLAGIESGGGRATAWLLLLPAAAALVIPANLSPLGLWNFNRWMERFTERIAPFLLPSQAPTRLIGEELSRLSLDRFLVELAGRGRDPAGWAGSFFLLAAVFLAVAFVAWRVFRTPVRPGRPVRMGRLPVGFRWLYEEVRAYLRQWFARWFARWRSVSRVGGTAVTGAEKAQGRTRRPRRGQYASVTAIYVDAVQRMGRRGLLRRETETPLEFLRRYRLQAAAGDDADFVRLTDLYMLERYGERRSTAGALQEARRAAARALRIVSRAKAAAAVKSWVRQIGARSRTGE